MGDFINIFEMSPRDGLQNEKNFIATKDKIKFIKNKFHGKSNKETKISKREIDELKKIFSI